MGIENTAGALAFWNHEVASATEAACDFCVKNDAIRANASHCGHWDTAQAGSSHFLLSVSGL